MRADLEPLLRERGLGGLVVFAYDRYSPAMHYVTGVRLRFAVYVMAADGRSRLIHDEMESTAAASTGLDVTSFGDAGLHAMFAEEGTSALAFARLIAEACASMDIRGTIGLFGDLPAAYAHALIRRLHELGGPDIDASRPDPLTVARMTKEPDEINSIRRVAAGTVAAFDRVVGFLQSARITGDAVLGPDGSIVRLGTLRRIIHREFLEHGLGEREGESIVSQGADAGVPHSRGDDAAAVRLGAPIVIDIFPGESGGGYSADFTRTLCVGTAPAPLADLYRDVQEAVTTATQALEIGRPMAMLHELVCDVFEARGHPTIRQNVDTVEGYCHGLGHGLGLEVHEEPMVGGMPSTDQAIVPGLVFTIEPGLYYPSRELGVRLEDLWYVRPDGTFEKLTPAPYQLEVHPQG
jgi:Xaa-Pro aminopeptidase